jgi:hypothetical protein
MGDIPRKLTRELDRKRLPGSIELEFIKLGRIAYDYLYNAVKERIFSDRQTVNALHLLFMLTREHCYGLQNQLLQLTLELSSDANIDVRTIATVISIRIFLITKTVPGLEIPLAQRNIMAPFVERAIQLGLKSQHDQSYAEDFLKGKI